MFFVSLVLHASDGLKFLGFHKYLLYTKRCNATRAYVSATVFTGIFKSSYNWDY